MSGVSFSFTYQTGSQIGELADLAEVEKLFMTAGGKPTFTPHPHWNHPDFDALIRIGMFGTRTQKGTLNLRDLDKTIRDLNKDEHGVRFSRALVLRFLEKEFTFDSWRGGFGRGSN